MASATASPASGDEAGLVEQARAGDMSAFSRLIARYQDRVVNACWRISGNADDAHDLAQEAILRALESIDRFQHKSGFYTWLFRIATNLAISHRRQAARRVKLSLHGPDGQFRGDQPGAQLAGRVSTGSDDPSVRLSSRETQERVAEELDRLEDDHRAVVVLRDIEGFDYREIAEILDVPVGTVKSRLYRARMELRDRLGPVVGAG